MNIKHQWRYAYCVIGLCVGSAAWADFAATTNFTNNYVWRGLTQTDNNPALQGSIQYNHESGLYAGLWGSNVDFLDVDGDTATLEVDEYVGFNHAFENGFGVDLSYLYYSYPGTSGINFGEVVLKGSYDFLTLGVSYTNDYGGTGGDSLYYAADVAKEIPEKLAFGLSGFKASAGVGYSDFDEIVGDNYIDYRVGLTKAITKIISVGIMGTTTDRNYLDSDVDEPHLIVNLSAALS